MLAYNNIFDTTNHEFDISEIILDNNQTLKFNNTLGIGFINPPENSTEIYDEDYWNRYRAMINTEIGKNLTQCRIDIANNFNVIPLRLLDVGIGNGDFVDKFGCYGTDVNPHAIKYLKQNRKFIDIDNEKYMWEWMSFFDVLEHIVDASSILSKVEKIIMSVPIHNNLDSLLVSKHLRPEQHFWHFTVHGLIYYMGLFGFNCKYYSTIESKLGRESIGSFVFTRK